MAYNDLIQSMEEGAGEKIAEIRSEMQRTIENIRRESSERAEEVHRSLLEEARSAAKDQRNRTLFQVRGEENEALTREKEHRVNEAFKKAGERMKEMRKDPSYRDLFSGLLSESLAAVDIRDIQVHVDPRDQELCRSSLSERSVRADVIPDLTTAGGVELSSADGRIKVYNTLESRLEKARSVYNKEVCRFLFGE
jgi:V/A-type H+-transporting ATPase subunit E